MIKNTKFNQNWLLLRQLCLSQNIFCFYLHENYLFGHETFVKIVSIYVCPLEYVWTVAYDKSKLQELNDFQN